MCPFHAQTRQNVAPIWYPPVDRFISRTGLILGSWVQRDRKGVGGEDGKTD